MIDLLTWSGHMTWSGHAVPASDRRCESAMIIITEEGEFTAHGGPTRWGNAPAQLSFFDGAG